MISSTRTCISLIVAVVLLPSCKTSPEADNREAVAASDSGIILSASQVKNGAVTFGQIVKKQLSFDIMAKGKLSLPPGNSATISSMSGGVVEEILVQPGDHVSRGKVLARIASPDIIRIQQDYLSAENRYRLVESEYLRQKELVGDGITSEKKFLEAESSYNAVKIEREALRMHLELLNLPVSELQKGTILRSAPIVSQIDGDVDRIHVNLGRYIGQNDVLFTVVNKNRLNIDLMVFEKDVPFISQGQRVTFELANLGETVYEAHVINIGRTVEEDARTVRVLAEFVNNSPHILPGMFVAAEIHTAEQEVDALPEEAVVTDHDGSYCFYALSGETDREFRFFRLPLKTGFREDNYIQVEPLTMLPAGARIVNAGTYFVKAEGLKKAR